jgi:hypothetical protein
MRERWRGPSKDGGPSAIGRKVLWSASEGARTAAPHFSRISSVRKSVVAVAERRSVLPNVRCAPIATKFRSAAKCRDVNTGRAAQHRTRGAAKGLNNQPLLISEHWFELGNPVRSPLTNGSPRRVGSMFGSE